MTAPLSSSLPTGPVLSTLMRFNAEFGTEDDLSRYESIKSSNRVTSPAVNFLNQLQMDSFIPAKTALLLKNNLHDNSFITFTTRTLLYNLRQENKIGQNCFQFLHEKINKGQFAEIFEYLYIVMLYCKIKEKHDAGQSDPDFRFESLESYSNKLVACTPINVRKEKEKLQFQDRKAFLKEWMTATATASDRPREVSQQFFSLVASLDESKEKFRAQFTSFLEKLQNTPELEKLCWGELASSLRVFTKPEEFFEQVYLRLKTENYYKTCIARVTTLKEALATASSDELESMSERCKKAFNGCAYLLGDSKNMPNSSPMRFAAITGKMRSEWVAINTIFSRAARDFSHQFCSCQGQIPATQNQLADWPFGSIALIPPRPAPPLRLDQLVAQGINPSTYQDNQNRTVAIMGCHWGSGHSTVSAGIADFLTQSGMHAMTCDLPEILMSEDPVRNNPLTKLLKKDWSIGNLFNGLMNTKAFALINLMRGNNVGKPDPVGDERKVKIILEHLLKINPQSVVSTYSAHDVPLLKACQILGIPLLHVSTDVDPTTFQTDYAHFRYCVPFNERVCLSKVESTLKPEQLFVSGPPVRKQFLKTRTAADVQQLKQKWGIEQNKKVVVVTNGRNGLTTPYPEILAKKYASTSSGEIPIHLVVLCGKDNKKFLDKIERKISPGTNLPITALSYAGPEEMEELMTMAAHGGCLVGKAGGATIFEAFTRGTRILVDDVRPRLFDQGVKHFFVTMMEMILRKCGYSRQLPWEKVNTGFARDQGLSNSFKDEKQFLPKLDEILRNDNAPVRVQTEVKNFQTEVSKNVRDMMLKAQFSADAIQTRRVYENLTRAL